MIFPKNHYLGGSPLMDLRQRHRQRSGQPSKKTVDRGKWLHAALNVAR